MKIEITLDKSDAVLECVNLEELKKCIREESLKQVYKKLSSELCRKRWADYCNGDAIYGMFKLINEHFILIPRHKKWTEFFEDKPIESTRIE